MICFPRSFPRKLKSASIGDWLISKPLKYKGLNGRGGQIRTDDPLPPRQVRYQAALRPDTALDAVQGEPQEWRYST